MEQGLEFFDSNILIAASVSAHVHHAASASRLATLQSGGGAMAAHSLAEAYNNLTHPKRYGLPPEAAGAILRRATQTYSVVSLTAEETMTAISHVQRFGLVGGIVYDALLIACARKIEARAIYTWNVKHFRLVAPDLAGVIQSP